MVIGRLVIGRVFTNSDAQPTSRPGIDFDWEQSPRATRPGNTDRTDLNGIGICLTFRIKRVRAHYLSLAEATNGNAAPERRLATGKQTSRSKIFYDLQPHTSSGIMKKIVIQTTISR